MNQGGEDQDSRIGLHWLHSLHWLALVGPSPRLHLAKPCIGLAWARPGTGLDWLGLGSCPGLHGLSPAQARARIDLHWFRGLDTNSSDEDNRLGGLDTKQSDKEIIGEIQGKNKLRL